MTKVGRGWPPEPATRNSGERVGQEGGKKSDKTMERNLNYAPRKMAIVCKAMLIRRRRKGAAGAVDFADAEAIVRCFFFLFVAGTVSQPSLPLASHSFCLSSPPLRRHRGPAAMDDSPVPHAVAPLFTHLARRFASSPPVDRLLGRVPRLALSLPFLLPIYLTERFASARSMIRND